MYYNRTVSSALIDALSPAGPFAGLAGLARDRHLADLQLRGYPNTARCWATLYVGLTKVVDVVERDAKFTLTGTAANPKWSKQQGPKYWHAVGDDLAVRLDEGIRKVGTRFTNEGAVQAMLCTRASSLFSVVDREAVVGFTNTAERTATYTKLQTPLSTACRPDPKAPWFVPKKFGGELDLLAIDDDGRLLAIEIKPGSATSGITWAPLQATFYAELLQAWSTEVGEQSVEAIHGMLDQRVKLGLTRDPERELRYPLEIVPIVAIGDGPKSPAALPRLQRVQTALLDAGVGWPTLEVWTVRESVAREYLMSPPSTPTGPSPSSDNAESEHATDPDSKSARP